MPCPSAGYLRRTGLCASPAEAAAFAETEFEGVADYIDRITYAIWEEKDVGSCDGYYSADCPVYTIAGITVGAAEVVDATLATLEAFPDRTLFPLGLVWGADNAGKFHSSHLISSRLTHHGTTEHGPPTGRRARILTIAHCVIEDGVIVEEWLVRDNYLLAVQLGCDPLALAVKRAQAPAQSRLAEWLGSEYARVRGAPEQPPVPVEGTGGGDGTAPQVCARLHALWNGGADAATEAVGSVFHKHAFVKAPAGRELVGHADLVEYFASWFAAFPDARWCADFATDAHSLGGSAVGRWLAVRWILAGEHARASARFGDASGARAVVLGEMHLLLHAETSLVVEGYIVYDELAVLEQIERARVRVAEPADFAH